MSISYNMELIIAQWGFKVGGNNMNHLEKKYLVAKSVWEMMSGSAAIGDKLGPSYLHNSANLKNDASATLC